MRTGKELIEFLDTTLKSMGKHRNWLSEQVGMSHNVWSMTKTRNGYPSVTILAKVAELLGITIEELLGIECPEPQKKEYDADVKKMADMLMEIPPEIRKGIEANIVVLYNMEIGKKDVDRAIG